MLENRMLKKICGSSRQEVKVAASWRRVLAGHVASTGENCIRDFVFKT
jgi:hypothetical protein